LPSIPSIASTTRFPSLSAKLSFVAFLAYFVHFIQQTLHFPFNRTRLLTFRPPATPPYTDTHTHKQTQLTLWRADKRAEKVLNLMATPKNAATATGK